MQHFLCYLLLTLLLACGPADSASRARTAAPAAETPAASTSPDAVSAPAHRQVLVVITPDWDQPVGTLYPLAWQDSGWQVAEPPIPVLIGKNGLGWGIGLADYRDRQGPVKREGDLKSPAGIFTLGTAFGYAPAQAAGFLRMPYVHVSETLMCIEDTGSQAYNRIVDQAQTPVDWSSTDQMRRKDDLYEWGMLVEHNYEPSLPGGGSCIFLHVWREGGRGTAGCTSMDKARLRQLLAWLDPAAAPLLLQAPTRQYPALAQILDLPALP